MLYNCFFKVPMDVVISKNSKLQYSSNFQLIMYKSFITAKSSLL